MPEVAVAGEDHRQATLVGRGDDFVVTHAATGLDDAGRAGIGHHIQTVLGTAADVRDAQRALGETGARRLQVAMELQADCYAGVWAHHANRRNRVLEPGDADEALAAAAAIGDDRLQRNAGRRVTPESFTHGSSAERRTWLLAGLESGNVAACDTFDRAP